MSTEKLAEFCKTHELTIAAVFVPFSLSRKSKVKPKLSEMSLNWRVTLNYRGRKILETDYTAGIGYCPSYKQGRLSVDDDTAIRNECETGKAANRKPGLRKPGKPIIPDTLDVVESLASNLDAIDYGSFAEWADSLGYNSDSIAHKTIYENCLECALKLRSMLGEKLLGELREACQDN